MAGLAWNYHDEIQTNLEESSLATLTTATWTVLQAIDHRLSENKSEFPSDYLSYNDIANALDNTASGKASGLDDILYEFWKHLA